MILSIQSLYHYLRSCVTEKNDLLHELKEQPAVQNLEDYFKHLKDKDIESWIKEEVVGKERLNFERLNETSFNELVKSIQNTEERKKLSKLQGGANYDIL